MRKSRELLLQNAHVYRMRRFVISFAWICLLGGASLSRMMAVAEAEVIPAAAGHLFETALEEDGSGPEPDAGNGVRWGLLDAAVTAGRLFRYQLPHPIVVNDKGAQYKVVEAGKHELPTWLNFDDDKNLLEGVAGSGEVGSTYYMEVTARSRYVNHRVTTSKDVFVIRVKEDDGPPDSVNGDAKPLFAAGLHENRSEPIKCGFGSAVTMATVIVDADLDRLSSSEKINLLRNSADHLNLPPEELRMLQASGVAASLLESTDLVAGPGDVLKPEHEGVLVQWIVGCGNVVGRHMNILQKLELTVHDGSLTKSIGHGISGWHVTNLRAATTAGDRRRRRVPNPTATSQPTLRLPTGRPTATVVVHPTDGPESRIVPSRPSPVLSTASQTAAHRSKTRGRHNIQKTVKPPKHHHPSTRLPDDSKTVTPVLTVLPTVTQQPAPTIHPGGPDDILEPSLVFSTGGFAGSTKFLTRSSLLSTATNVTTSNAGRSAEERTSTQSVEEEFNYPPLQKNDMERLTVSVGEVFRYRVPNDTFLDPEDGSTRNLRLIFLTVDGLTMAPNSWIKFNERTQTLYGMPLEEHAGRQDYILSAIDGGGKLARDTFEIVVMRRLLDRRINHEMKLILDLDYQIFMQDVDLRVAVAGKIAAAYGDADARRMIVTRISEGSVEFHWTNTTIFAVEDCPVDDLNQLIDHVITPDDRINVDFLHAMEPYGILYFEFLPKGACLAAMQFISVARSSEGTTVKEDDGDDDPETRPKTATDPIDNLIVTTIIPTLIVIVILVIAFALVCALCGRKNKGTEACSSSGSGGGGQGAGNARKGVPVIFADELEEKPNVPTKPLIMTDEKPPVAPPNYDQATASNSPSSPRSLCRDPLIEREDVEPAPSPHRSSTAPHSVSSVPNKRNSRVQMQQLPQQQHAIPRNPPPYVTS